MKWSHKQELAISAKDKNILVSANAGSGKTAVLAERVLRIVLEEKVGIDQFLIVTFTSLAADEMRQRIHEKFMDILKTKDEEFIKMQTLLVNLANISTLHSFGLSLIRDYFYLLSLDPTFKIADEIEMRVLKSEIVNQLFERYYKEGDKQFFDAMSTFSTIRNDDGLKKEIFKIVDFVSSLPDPEAFLKQNQEKRMETVTNTTAYDMILQETKKSIEEAVNVLWENQDLSLTFEEDRTLLKELLNRMEQGYKAAYPYIHAMAFSRIKYPKESTEENKEKAKKIREVYCKGIVSEIKQKYFAKEEEAILKEEETVSRSRSFLVSLVLQFMKAFSEEKRRRNVLEFNDIEHFTLELLLNPQIQSAMRQKFRYVIVDEYQDISPLQEEILKRVSIYEGRIPNLFMVGDIKQSIYKFRKAEPEIFAQKYNHFKTEGEGENQRIDLNQNYRSRQEVLSSINCIFKRIMIKEIGEIAYDENMELTYGDLYDLNSSCDYQTEMMLIPSPENPNEAEEPVKNIELEAESVSFKIKELVDQGFRIYDMKAGGYRTVSYKDFAILFRSMKNVGNVFYETLVRNNIPVVMNESTLFIQTQEVQTILCILKALDNPYDEISMLTILYSPIFKFTPDELTLIRTDRIHGFFESLHKHRKDERLQAKIQRFFVLYEKWSTVVQEESISSLVQLIYEDTEYRNQMMNYKNSDERVNNLNYLLEVIYDFEKGRNAGLYDFIRYVKSIEGEEADIKLVKEVDYGDSVKIMSVHKSKGLEFPIVFLPALSRKFNVSDTREGVLIDKELGIEIGHVDLDTSTSGKTLFLNAAQQKTRMEALAEEIRILYVAMTRAREKLFLVSAVDDLEKKFESWSDHKREGRINYNYLKNAYSFLELMGPVLVEERTEQKNIRITEWLEQKMAPWEEQKTWFDVSEFFHLSEETEDFVYPYQALSRIKQKMSVTELKQKQNQELHIERSFQKYVRAGGQEDLLQGAKLGTVVHNVLKMIDAENLAVLKEKLDGLLQEGKLTKLERESIDSNQLMLYFNSPLARRIREAKEVRREMPFMMKKDVRAIYPEVSSKDDFVIIQGIMDCLFFEEDGCVILDYKTDKGNPRELAKEYKAQLDLYEEAIQNIFGWRVKQKILYFVRTGEEIEV